MNATSESVGSVGVLGCTPQSASVCAEGVFQNPFDEVGRVLDSGVPISESLGIDTVELRRLPRTASASPFSAYVSGDLSGRLGASAKSIVGTRSYLHVIGRVTAQYTVS